MVINIPQTAKQNPETKPSYVTLQNEQNSDIILGKKLKFKKKEESENSDITVGKPRIHVLETIKFNLTFY